MADDPVIDVTINPPAQDTEKLGGVQDNVNEITSQIEALELASQTRQNELLERLKACQLSLTQLSNLSGTATESPLLTQISIQLAELKTELLTLRSSMAVQTVTIPNPPIPNGSVILTETPPPDVVVPADVADLSGLRTRKNRFV